MQTSAPLEGTQHLCPHAGPCLYALDIVAYHRDVPKQQQQCKEQSGIERPSIKDLDTLRQQPFNQLGHRYGQPDALAAASHSIERLCITRQAIGDIVIEPVGLKCRANQSADEHVEDVEHAERLEEVLERHHFVQTPHQRDAHHGIGETAASERQSQCTDIKPRIDQEIEAGGICRKDKEPQGHEFVGIPSEYLQPKQSKQTSRPYAGKRPQAESLVNTVGIVHDFLVINHFEHVFTRKQRLDNADQYDNGYYIAVAPHGRFEEWLRMKPHALQADGERQQRRAAQQADTRRVPPVLPVTEIQHIGHL